ncbi:MAG TPA: O-antigen ligase family protein [Edaphocola sp.]|uniref:O-antigen ligase family protein n=1 Tax=Denitrificimonas caeni TaxID=521720 RepID=UPI0003B3A0FE|nr:O-antigen ligase family protein [Denitrificimonas caeni]HTO15625.1 O-antigen ligase family protein [Edaphocola sp.]
MNGSLLFPRMSIFLLPVILFFYYFGNFFWFFDDTSLNANIRALVIFLAIVGGVSYSPVFFNGSFFSKIKSNKLFLIVFLFLSYASINSFLILEDMKMARRSLLVFSFVFIIGFSFFEKCTWELFLRALAISSFGFALFSLINMYRIDALPTGYRMGGISVSGVEGVADFGNTIIAAMHYAMGFTAALYLFFTETNKYKLVFWVMTLGTLSLYIILTFSRAGWLACLIPLVIMTLFLYDNKKKVRWFVLFSFLFCVLSFFVTVYLNYEVGQRGLTHRDEIWLTVISRMPGSWLFGHGAGANIEPILVAGTTYVNNSHNVYLEVLYKLGLVGVLFFVGVLIFSIYILYKNREHYKYGSIAVYWLSVLCSSAVVMTVELNELIHTPNMLWHWFWMPVAFAILVDREKYE